MAGMLYMLPKEFTYGFTGGFIIPAPYMLPMLLSPMLACAAATARRWRSASASLAAAAAACSASRLRCSSFTFAASCSARAWCADCTMAENRPSRVPARVLRRRSPWWRSLPRRLRVVREVLRPLLSVRCGWLQLCVSRRKLANSAVASSPSEFRCDGTAWWAAREFAEPLLSELDPPFRETDCGVCGWCKHDPSHRRRQACETCANQTYERPRTTYHSEGTVAARALYLAAHVPRRSTRPALPPRSVIPSPATSTTRATPTAVAAVRQWW